MNIDHQYFDKDTISISKYFFEKFDIITIDYYARIFTLQCKEENNKKLFIIIEENITNIHSDIIEEDESDNLIGYNIFKLLKLLPKQYKNLYIDENKIGMYISWKICGFIKS